MPLYKRAEKTYFAAEFVEHVAPTIFIPCKENDPINLTVRIIIRRINKHHVLEKSLKVEKLWDILEKSLKVEKLWDILEKSLKVEKLWDILEKSLKVEKLWDILEKSLKVEKLWDILEKSWNFLQKSLGIYASSMNKNNVR